MALRNLSVNDSNELKIAEEGALPPLIALLRSPDKRIQMQALGVLRNLSVSPANKVSACAYVCVYIHMYMGVLRNLSVSPANKVCVCAYVCMYVHMYADASSGLRFVYVHMCMYVYRYVCRCKLCAC